MKLKEIILQNQDWTLFTKWQKTDYNYVFSSMINAIYQLEILSW